MKKFIFFILLTVTCSMSFSNECCSEAFSFDGNEITEEALFIKPTDPLAYSSVMASGSPRSLTITVGDKSDPLKTATLFADYSGSLVEGTVCWNYKDQNYKDFPLEDIYILIETIISDSGSKVFTRNVTLLPEPIGVFILGLAAFIFCRKHTRVFLLFITVLTITSLSVFAESTVSDVKCQQMWPFDRSVIINYTIESNTNVVKKLKFYGSLDNGETFFDLSQYGTITILDTEGTSQHNGNCKALWMPGRSFYGKRTNKMRIKVEIKEDTPPPTGDSYMVVDLESGKIDYIIGTIPEGGWSDEYKTTKLLLRRIEPGSFIMGSPEEKLKHKVTLTKPFYIGVFEVTQKQHELIMGKRSYQDFKGDMRPVMVSYEDIRGEKEGNRWPESSDIDEDSFLAKLRAKTNRKFDLPTEAQWEYACKAGTTTSWNNGTEMTNQEHDPELDKLGRYYYNGSDGKGGYNNGPTTVGSYLPNAWGLYDMHGNISEWCLDSYGRYSGDAVDPKGPSIIGDYVGRVVRGGCYYDIYDDGRHYTRAFQCQSHFRDYGIEMGDTLLGVGYFGLRLVLETTK